MIVRAERARAGVWNRVWVSALAALAIALLSLPANAEEQIDPRSGRLFSTVTDFVVTAGPVKLELQRSLSSGGIAHGLLGARWALNWDSRLSRVADLITIEEGSASITFSPQAGGAEYRSASGERLTLQPDGRAVRRRSDEAIDTFDAQGRLLERADRNGNKVALQYGPGGRLTRIEGPRGASLRFTTDTNGRLTRVETSTGRTVEYAYFGESLAEVRANNGPIRRYGYDGGGRLARIEDPATGSVEMAYDARDRVVSRRFSDGATERYEYDDATNAVRHVDAAGAATTMRWSADKRRAEVTDALGGKSVMLYDDAGRLVSVTGPTGATSRMTHDSAGRLISTENGGGQVTRFEYVGSSPRFQTIIRPDGTRQSFEYDNRGNLTASKIGAETVTAFTYNPDGSIATVKGEKEAESRFTYRPDGRIETIANALGAATRFEYDGRGNIVRTINPLGGATTRAYDSQDRLVAVTDPAGGTRRYEYDAAGRVIAITDALGGTTRYQYDLRGRLVAETDTAGQTIRSEYDGAGRLSRRNFPDGTSETFRYDILGNVVAAVDRSGGATQLEYDPLGRVVRERNPAGLAMEYRYDAAGYLIAQQDALGTGPTLRHDPVGRLLEFKSPTGAAIQYSYDAAGRVIGISDPLGHAKRFQYGADGALAEVRAADGSSVRYSYDAAGRITGIRHPSGGETRFSYDSAGNALQVTNPAGQAVQRSYDGVGRVTTVTRPNGQTIAYRYDALGRMVEKRFSAGMRVTYEYDARGNLLKADDGSFPVVYRRDPFGRVSQIEYPALRKSLRYEYDAAGLVSRMTDGDGGVTRYAYDAAGRPTTVTLPGGQTITFAYDARGRPATVQYPNGVTGRSEYDEENRLSGLSYTDASGKVLAAWRHRFDRAGNRVETTTADGSVTRYRYDAAGQLIEEAVAAGLPLRYGYLPGGNRERREIDGQAVQYRYDAADQLLQAGAESFTHDANGNLVERRGPKGTTRYEYDSENRLVKLIPPTGSEVSFGYAPTGARVWRRDASGITYFVSDGVNLLAELDENFKTKASYQHARGIDVPLVMTREGHAYYFHRDHIGSIRLLTGDKADPVASYEYDAFGLVQHRTGSIANPFMFAAREAEPDSSLYYFRARYYDAALGRFLSVDLVPPPLNEPSALNQYIYAANNPLRFVDPLGLDWSDAERLYNFESLAQWSEDQAAKGWFPEDNLKAARNFRSEAEWLRNKNPGIQPEPPPGYGGRPFPTETPQTGGPGRVRAGGAAAPGQPPPGVTQEVPAAGPRGGPTQAVPRDGAGAAAGSETQAVPRQGANDPAAPTAGAPNGSGISWGRVGGGVVTAGVGLANVYACINESGKTAKDCLAEAGLIIGSTAAGILIAPAIASGLIALGVSPAVLVAGGVAAAAVGIYQAGNRLVNAANEPATIAAAQRQAELEARFATLFPGMSAKIEAQVAAFEKKAGSSSAGAVREARTRAEAFADAAASNLAALRGDLSQAGAFCAVANRLAQEMNALAADSENRLNMLDTGLTAADGIVAACKDKDRVTQAKELYDQGIRMAAEMVVLAQRADKAQGLLQEARASANQSFASAEQRAQMISGNAEVAQAAADQARAIAGDGNAARLAGLAGERAALDGEINAFPNWFPARPEVAEAVGGWRGRVAAAFARAQESGPDQADVSAAGLAATRAASRRDETASLIAEAKARVDGCEQSATAAIDNSVASTTAANAAAAGTLGRFSGLPAAADACIVKLNTPAARTLVALHVQCPPRAYVGDSVSCSANGVFDDNLGVAEDMTPGSWSIGPTFTSQQAGSVTVQITRFNMSDQAMVTFENKPPPSAPGGYNPFNDPNFMPGAPKPPVNVGQTGSGTTPTDGPPSPGGGLGQGGAPIPSNYGQPTGESKPAGPTSGPGSQPQPISCWSDQMQMYVQVMGYTCPSSSTPSGSKPPQWTDLPLTPSTPSGGSPPMGGHPPGYGPAKGGSSGPAPCPPGKHREASEPEKGCH